MVLSYDYLSALRPQWEERTRLKENEHAFQRSIEIAPNSFSMLECLAIYAIISWDEQGYWRCRLPLRWSKGWSWQKVLAGVRAQIKITADNARTSQSTSRRLVASRCHARTVNRHCLCSTLAHIGQSPIVASVDLVIKDYRHSQS